MNSEKTLLKSMGLVDLSWIKNRTWFFYDKVYSTGEKGHIH